MEVNIETHFFFINFHKTYDNESHDLLMQKLIKNEFDPGSYALLYGHL